MAFETGGLRVRCRDNGGGIDETVVAADAAEQHFGLPGMRERAIRIGGELTVRSRLGNGTEIELTVPGRRAYMPARSRRFWRREVESKAATRG